MTGVPSIADFEDFGTCEVCEDPFIDEDDWTWVYSAGSTEEYRVHNDTCVSEGMVSV